MYSEPGDANALRNHLRILLQDDNEGNEDFLPIILKTSSLSLFSSVSLFVLIDAGKTTPSAVAHAAIGVPVRRHPGQRRAADATLDSESNVAVQKLPAPRLFGTGALISWLDQQA